MKAHPDPNARSPILEFSSGCSAANSVVGKIVFAISGITNRIRPGKVSNMVQSSTIRPDMANTIFATVNAVSHAG
jgi:hypothetical protein